MKRLRSSILATAGIVRAKFVIAGANATCAVVLLILASTLHHSRLLIWSVVCAFMAVSLANNAGRDLDEQYRTKEAPK